MHPHPHSYLRTLFLSVDEGVREIKVSFPAILLSCCIRGLLLDAVVLPLVAFVVATPLAFILNAEGATAHRRWVQTLCGRICRGNDDVGQCPWSEIGPRASNAWLNARGRQRSECEIHVIQSKTILNHTFTG